MGKYQFSESIEIYMPREKVVEHFKQREHYYKKWFPDAISETTTGVPYAEGTVTEVKFDKFVLTETVLENQLPDRLKMKADANGPCINTMESVFCDNGDTTTYEVHVDYTHVAFVLKVMCFFMPNMLKGQVKKYLERFKATAEAA